MAGVALSGRWPHAAALSALLACAGAVACALPCVAGTRVAAALGVAALAAPLGWWMGVRAHEHATRRPLRAALANRLAEGREGEPLLIRGRLDEDALPAEDGAVLVVDVDAVLHEGGWRALHGRVRVSVRGDAVAARAAAWRRGRCVQAPALLRVPQTFRDPGVADQDLQLARRGIELVGTVKSGALVETCGAGPPWMEGASVVRDAMRAALATHVGRHGPQSAAVVAAILIGDRASLDDDVEERLRKAGTFHVLAISGGNIALLSGVLLWTLAGVRAPPRWAACLAIAGLAAYALVVVRGASVDRALLVAFVYLAASAGDIRADPLALLASAAVAIVCVSPVTVFDLGFALTFGATSGLIVVAPPLLAAVREVEARTVGRVRPSGARLLGASVVATLAAESVVLPIGAAGFGRVTFAGIALNVVAIPLMAVAQVAGLLTTALDAPAGQAAGVSGWVAHLAVAGLVESARLVEVWPWLVRPVAPPAWWLLIVYGAALAGACLPWIGVRARAACAVVVLVLVAAILAGWGPARSNVLAARLPPAWVTEPTLRVTVLDVGQGDAVLVQFASGRAMLIDTGGIAGARGFDIGRRVVSPAMHALGVRRLDWLVLTHGDPDHVGGALSLMQDWRPREVWEGIPVEGNVVLADLRAQAMRDGASWRRALAGDEVVIEDVVLRVWHPGPQDWERQRVRNDDSVVVELRTAGVSIVLPGDIGRSVERRLAGAWRPARTCVLKAAHHGSAGSSDREWMAALRPGAVIYSAGQGNWFGHPTAAALASAAEVGAEVFRTDLDGAVQVAVTSSRVTISTFTGRWWSRPVE